MSYKSRMWLPTHYERTTTNLLKISKLTVLATLLSFNWKHDLFIKNDKNVYIQFAPFAAFDYYDTISLKNVERLAPPLFSHMNASPLFTFLSGIVYMSHPWIGTSLVVNQSVQRRNYTRET